MFAHKPPRTPQSHGPLRADVRLGATYKRTVLCIFMHNGLSRPLRRLHQKPYSVVPEVVNLKCYLLNSLDHVVEATPTNRRFGGSRYTLATKSEF